MRTFRASIESELDRKDGPSSDQTPPPPVRAEHLDRSFRPKVDPADATDLSDRPSRLRLVNRLTLQELQTIELHVRQKWVYGQPGRSTSFAEPSPEFLTRYYYEIGFELYGEARKRPLDSPFSSPDG